MKENILDSLRFERGHNLFRKQQHKWLNHSDIPVDVTKSTYLGLCELENICNHSH